MVIPKRSLALQWAQLATFRVLGLEAISGGSSCAVVQIGCANFLVVWLAEQVGRGGARERVVQVPHAVCR